MYVQEPVVARLQNIFLWIVLANTFVEAITGVSLCINFHRLVRMQLLSIGLE